MSLPLARLATDPVCGMQVDPARAAGHADHDGQTYHFCSAHCQRRFTADPDSFLHGQAARSMTTPPEAPATKDDYTPLVVVLLLITTVAAVLSWTRAAEGAFSPRDLVSDFMTGFFLVFAGFKLLDLRGFAEGYANYDLLARRLPAYGYVYPFIELAFGLLMLAGIQPDGLLWTEAAVMAFSGLGVGLKIAKREPFRCACLGTALKVPLTTVTLVEDFGMAALAIVLIYL